MEKYLKIFNRKCKSQNREWRKNWIIKLLSFCLALFLWYFVVGEDKVDRTIFIPLEIFNLPQELVISNQFKRELEVSVNGPRGLINSISGHDVTRAVDLTDAVPGTVVVQNNLSSISFPRGIRVLRVQPPNVILLLDRLIKKNLRIKAVTTGTPAEGYEILSIQLDPPILSITGPQEILGDLALLTTDPVDIGDLKSSTVKQVGLIIDSKLSGLIGEPVVTAKITVKEKQIEKTIRGIPLKLNHVNTDIKYSFMPETVSIKASVPYHLAMDSKKLKTFIEARVKAGNLPPGKHKLKVEITSPGTVEIYEINPKMVVVELIETPIITIP
ncbi:MAG: CdaR family protein [Thermodesulfobacteriota bacterium]|nr:CdaR family protein [Thermodesulfobacteriota bacterium]